MSTLIIRYANPNTTPATHRAQGYGVGVPMIQPGLVDGGGVWTLTGPQDMLAAHLNRALNANDLNSYAWQ